jgi:ABC-type long-subunit fatty acid transport system fused permease/ATPase subunit
MNLLKRPALLTAALLALLLGLIFLRTHGWRLPANVSTLFSRSRATAATPEDTVYRMLDAARAGNTAVYVDAFSGPLQQQIQQVVRESGKTQFATYLTGQSSSFQSVALSVTDQPSDLEARLRVEYVYSNRNEVQTYHVRKFGSHWKIVGISGTDLTKTLIPYGTAVTDD